MIRPFASFLSATALALCAPAFAQDEETVDLVEDAQNSADGETFEFLSEDEEALAELKAELDAEFGLLADLFKAEPLTPEQESRLPRASEMASIIIPDGSLSIAMSAMMDPLMGVISAEIANDPRVRVSEVTGVSLEDLEELDHDSAQEALDIFDPQFAQRTDKMMVILTGMIGDMFNALEPAYRDAYARALTTRYEGGEMKELLAFFGTPLGARFAVDSYTIQFDPQMLGVMEQMGPALIEVLPSVMEGMVELEAEFEGQRYFGELSEAERERAADLLAKSPKELDALQPETEEDTSYHNDEETLT